MRRLLFAPLVMLAVAFALAACTTASPSPSPSPEVAATDLPEPEEPEGEPGPPAEGASSCTPPELCGGLLEPGTYTSASVGETISFSVDDGWIGTQHEELGFDLVRAEASAPQVISAVPFGGEVFSDVCSGQTTEEIGGSAAEFTAFLARRPGITVVSEPSPTTVGGRGGLDVEVQAGDPGCVSDPPERLWLWLIEGVVDFHLNVGETARLIALDGEERTTVLVIEAFSEEAYQELTELAQPVIASIEFE